jgi:hypothetical protein
MLRQVIVKELITNIILNYFVKLNKINIKEQTFKSITNLCYGVLAGVKVPFPLPQPDACTNGVSCPINAGTTFTQKISVPILNVYPSVNIV